MRIFKNDYLMTNTYITQLQKDVMSNFGCLNRICDNGWKWMFKKGKLTVNTTWNNKAVSTPFEIPLTLFQVIQVYVYIYLAKRADDRKVFNKKNEDLLDNLRIL